MKWQPSGSYISLKTKLWRCSIIVVILCSFQGRFNIIALLSHWDLLISSLIFCWNKVFAHLWVRSSSFKLCSTSKWIRQTSQSILRLGFKIKMKKSKGKKILKKLTPAVSRQNRELLRLSAAGLVISNPCASQHPFPQHFLFSSFFSSFFNRFSFYFCLCFSSYLLPFIWLFFLFSHVLSFNPSLLIAQWSWFDSITRWSLCVHCSLIYTHGTSYL